MVFYSDGIHNHHSATEDVRMLWQQIRHSKEQQTFSALSNRAALSALPPAVWHYCSQDAPRLCFKYARACTHTHKDKHSHTHWPPTVVRVYQHFVTSGSNLPREACYVHYVCLVWVCRCVSRWVCAGLCSANIWSLD